ncbi:unnamed protein product [Eruca vesicaria subsp. sativa]|uniref:26S proteasome non-ATPase regulatory subunit 3 N-terminal TPR repeats domain-containing protein n=1 Tax=Eruca vesicaria subsp. sativa TaxID=29727 RepID=A0ABC8KB08_ERUVS|nr:unnamed protein product [Eruca vesicaria subsp. sativa]
MWSLQDCILAFFELRDHWSSCCGSLLSLHHSVTLCHDELGQERLLNLWLINYLHYNLYDQAEKLRSKAPRFEKHSDQQVSVVFLMGIQEHASALETQMVKLISKQKSIAFMRTQLGY